MGTPTHFTIFTKGAGKAKPEVHFAAAGPGEAVRDFEIIDNHDYSYTVKYTAMQQVGVSVNPESSVIVQHTCTEEPSFSHLSFLTG